jgi:hypothetical protein
MEVGEKAPGLYSESIDLRSQPDGLFIFALRINGSEVSKIKAIKAH